MLESKEDSHYKLYRNKKTAENLCCFMFRNILFLRGMCYG